MSYPRGGNVQGGKCPRVHQGGNCPGGKMSRGGNVLQSKSSTVKSTSQAAGYVGYSGVGLGT